MATATVPSSSPPASSRELGVDDEEMFYYEEETVFDEEETILEEDFPLASQRGLRTLHEDNIMEDDEEEDEGHVEEEIIEILEVVQEDEYMEEPIPMEDELELDEDADDESSAWVDDGRDYTKDPHIFAGKSHVSDHFAAEEAGGEDEPFYLDVPDIEDVSSLEDNFSVVEETIGEDSKRKLNLSTASSREKLNASADWEELLSVDDDEEQNELQVEPSHPVSPNENHTAHLRRTLSIKLEREETPLFFGRTAELETLRQALEGIQDINNPRRLAWIYGKSGIGKTTLVESFLRDNVFGKAGILVGHGSFDECCAQAQRPYSALVDCFMQIVEQLMEDHDQPDNSWRDSIREALGKEAKLLVLLVPNIAQLLEIEHDETDQETDTFELSTGRLLERLRFVLRRFLRILCSHRTLVLFIDQVQSADEDSLRMIDTLLSTYALKNFFFIGCHRGVKQSHLLARIKSKLSAISATDIMMKPVDKDVTRNVIFHHLKELSSRMDSQSGDFDELSIWITERSGGDPNHINHLVRYLMENEKIRRDGNGKWSWDLSQLKGDKAIPSNSLDLVSERIKKLSPEAKLIIKSASFLGLKDCEIQLLKSAIPTCFVSKADEECPISDEAEIERWLDVTIEAGLMQLLSPGFYGFCNDTVRKAATLLLPKASSKLSALHFSFATQLQSELSTLPNTPHLKEDILRLVADHLTLATENLKDTRQKENLARIQLELAEESMLHASFTSAVRRLQDGLALLDQRTRWKQCYDLTLKLHLGLSRVHFCLGNVEKSKNDAETILAHSKADRDKIGAYELLMWISVTRNHLDEAISLVSMALKEIWNEEPSRDVEAEVAIVREVANGKTDNDILSLPEMTHKKIASKLCFLTRLAEISWMGQNYLNQDLAALKMIDITLRYGTSKYASLSYALYGVCLARRNLQREAFRFGNLAALTAQQDSPLGAQAVTFHHYTIAYWKRQFQASLEPLQASAIVALESNDIEHLSFRVGAYLSHVLATGSSLTMGDTIFRRFKEYAIAFRARETWLATIPFRLMLKLRGESIEPAERGFEKHTDSRAVQYGVFFQMIQAIFMQEVAIAEKLSNRLFLKPEGVWLPMRGFYEGLIATSLARASSGKIRVKHQRKAAKIIEVLGGWAKTGLKQVHHMANLINVELRILSDAAMPPDVASAMYDVAIGAAAKAGFVQHEALANERVGIMLHEQKQDELARKHLIRARELYRSWGALAKVRDIETKFPNYFLGSDVLPNTVLPKDPDHVGIGDLSMVPSLDFGESQMIHFDGSQSMAKPTEKVGANLPTEGIVRRESRVGSGPPPVRIPVVSGTRRGRTSSRAKAGKGGLLGTPGRAPPLPTPETKQDHVSDSASRPDIVQQSDDKSGEQSSELDTSKQPEIQSQKPRQKLQLPISFNTAKPKKNFSRSSASVDMQRESDLSDYDDDDDDLRSVQSDVGAQSDFGPGYEGEKRVKKKKKLRRKLKLSSNRVSDDTDDRRLARSHSLSSGFDAHSDSEYQVQEKTKRRVVATKKKKETSSLKRIPKRLETEGEQDAAPVGGSDAMTGTIKMKSKAKAEEETEVNPKKEQKVRRSASVDRSSKKKGSGSKKALLDEIRTKDPKRSKSKLVSPDIDQGKQKSRSKDDLLIEIKASGGNVSARKSKKKTSDSITRNSSEGMLKPTETTNETEAAQPIRALTRNVSWSGKPKTESKLVDKGKQKARSNDDLLIEIKASGGNVSARKSKKKTSDSITGSSRNSSEGMIKPTETTNETEAAQTTRALTRNVSWSGKPKTESKLVDEGKQKARSKDDLLIEIKASGGTVSARKSKKKTSDSVSSRNSGEAIIAHSATMDETDPAQPIQAVTRNLLWSGKSKTESQLEKKENKSSATMDLRPTAVATAPLARGIVKSLSWSGKRKDKSIKEDRIEIEPTVDSSSEQVSTTPSSPVRGVVRSLSWNGRRKKKNRDEEDVGVSKSYTAPITQSATTAPSIERKKTSKVKKEKKGDETSDMSQAQKAKKGLGLLAKMKRSTKKSSTDSKGGV